MSIREERIKVFEDTLDFIDYNKKLMESVEYAKEHTNVYFDDEYPAFDESDVKKMELEVTKERTFESAMRLHKESETDHIAVMNFGNAFHPGGGVAKGSGAQEESLCRCSTLYPLLTEKYPKDEFYGYHEELGSSRASDSVIYTENVIICKTDEDIPKRLEEKDWVKVDVITAAAPDLRKAEDMHYVEGEEESMTDAELFGYHVKRAIHILTIAASKEVDTLVLGAFGCGAFKNNPRIVASAYRTALTVFPKVFNKVVFAVYCTPTDTENYDVFKKILCEI
ncbi:MAG: TIGR02452 family protein [Butyrivibrio sp.]|nr:TIGR02452 family protein [Butyrivibrio sp.]